ncbi:hypothetical protein FHX44_112800 [Pseudonocardia hierapolitana]|uniref:Novel STAND NTPase 1 domain-containing protein n=1 Tax=Pseudonocardia hierapolitana TaxID=1128676 RepID=A0A561SPV9_9PSEU|nr:ATP-binding protein [Pseudonocardia hierapolitana]TWF76902.1 hypothetical protein FHX44_112800 [Pseudonocardia hierapolitana]
MARYSKVGSSAPSPVTTPRGINPFPGPRAYRRDDQPYFFGRVDEIEELTSLVLSSSATLLYAPSGAGKSSLLQAGVAPHLERRFDFVILPTVRLGAGTRMSSTDHASNPFVRAVCETIGNPDVAIPADITEAAATRRPDSSRRVLLILDQFEEVFNDPALWRQREEFFTALTNALEKNTWLRAIIALRSDYLADLVPHERNLPAKLVVRYQLESLTEEQAANAIASAFAASGLSLADDSLRVVLDALLEDITRPPGQQRVPGQHVNTIQLQIVCRRLWEELRDAHGDRQRESLLTPTTFSVRGSMSQFVDEAISEAVHRSHGDEAAIRWWLSNTLITPSGRRGFVVVDEQEAAGLPNSVIDALEVVRLIQLEQRHGLRLAELTHDSMIAGVEVSNEAWRRSRDRKRRRSSGMFLAALIGLLAVFPFLQIEREAIIAGPITQEDVGRGRDARLEFSGNRRGVVVDVLVSGQPGPVPAKFSVMEVGADGRDLPLVTAEIPLSPKAYPTTVPVRTSPDRTYAAVLAASNARYRLAVSSLPTVQVDEDRSRLVLSPRVTVLLEHGRRELISAQGLNDVAGVMPIAVETTEDWALIEGPPSPKFPILLLDPESSDNPFQPTIISRKAVAPPVQVGPGQSIKIVAHPMGLASPTIGSNQQPAGAEVHCSDSTKVKVVYGAADTGVPPTSFVGVGRDSVVLPMNVLNIQASHPQILLHGSATPGASCAVSVRSFSEPAVTEIGRRVLVVPESASANAFRIALPQDAVLVMNQNPGVNASLECASPEYKLALSSRQDKLLAPIPATMPCDLWLVRKDSSAGTLSLPIWVVDTSAAGGW